MIIRAFVLLLLVVTTAIPTPAFSQDVLGFFFDPAGTVDRATTTGPGQLVTGHLVIADPSRAAGIDSWECVVRFVTDGPTPVATWYLEGQALNALEAPSFIVGLGSPLPSANAVLLASVNIGVLEAQQKIAVHVLPHDPPSLRDPPVIGYPVHRPLYGSGTEIVPLALASGCTGLPSAIINDDGVPTVVEVEVEPFLNMGLTLDTWSRTIFITNQGEQTLVGTMGIEGAGYSYNHDGRSVTTATTMFRIEPGVPYPVTVHFEDTGTDDNPGRLVYQACDLTWETDLMTEPFRAICEVEPLFLDLGTITLGGFAYDTFRIWNRGDLPLYLDVRSLSPGFRALAGSRTFVDPHSYLDASVIFEPDSYGVFEGLIKVSNEPDCGPVTVIGRAVDATPGCEVLVQDLDFGGVVTGYSAQDTVRIQNTAEELLVGEIPLDTDCPGFSIESGGGPYSLMQDEILEVVVGFAPPDTGIFDCELFLGEACETASLTGTSVAPVTSCSLSNQQLDFGTVYLGGSRTRSLFVTNDGNTPMTINPQVQGPDFRVYYPAGPAVVAPGTTFTIGLQFRAGELGFFEDVLVLGNDLCPDVPLMANVAPVPPPVSRIGIYFDDSYQQSVIRDVPASTIPAYLVLKGANGSGALDSWGLCMILAGNNLLVSWDVAGDPLEAGDPPCHYYGLMSPLPVTDTMVLATMQIVVLGPESTSDFYLEPHPASPIPGSMVYHTTDGTGPYPMRTTTGSSLAAAINKHLPVAVELPTPRGVTTNGEVHLTWNYFGDEADGFHVWRRIGSGAEARLTATPVTGSGGSFSFTDKPDVFGPAELTYVCAAVKDGVEVARGTEVTVAYSGQPRPLTLALKPNYPNPFNPSTTVPFEIAKAGRVRLTVFDLAGRQIAVLADGEYGVGYHEEVWLGKDASGRQVPSGPYYLRLESGGQVRMRQMMLLK
jgi:hypothetical protein